jgi:hypothetical protein
VFTIIYSILRYYTGDTGGRWVVRLRGIKASCGAQGVAQAARRGRIAGRAGAAHVVGRRGVGGSRDVRRGASRGTQGTAQVEGREARAGCGAVPEGSRFPPTDESSSECVSGERRGRGGRKGREEVPAHVAQEGTLTSRGRSREEGSVHVAQTDPLSTGKGVAGGGGHPRCTDGHVPTGGSGGREG